MSHTLPVTGNTEKTRPENRAFYPALDGLRAAAFVMVFFRHYAGLPWGWAGVDLFFVLSGFLITGILFDTRDDTHRVRNFYVRRTLRIFPLYYGIILAIFLATPFLHWDWNWHWLIWPAYLGNYARYFHPTLINSPMDQFANFEPSAPFGGRHLTLYLGHCWSLCVEEQFYLVWPWLVFWIRDRRKLLVLCAITLPLCLAMRLAGQHFLPGWMVDADILDRTTPFRLDALLLGGLLALWLRGPGAAALLRAARIAAPFVVIILLLWAIFTPSGHLWRSPYIFPQWSFTWGLTVTEMIAAILILLAIQPGSFIYRIFSLRPLRWLGRISYGAYVLHDIPHAIFSRIGVVLAPRYASELTAAIALVFTVVAAWLSFRFFETPFLNLKERWTMRNG